MSPIIRMDETLLQNKYEMNWNFEFLMHEQYDFSLNAPIVMECFEFSYFDNTFNRY